VGYDLCQACYLGGVLVLKDTQQFDVTKYASIENQFQVGMKKKNYIANIVCILSVFDTKRFKDYTAYLKMVESNRNLKHGNEKRWWHGSALKCQLWKTKKVCGTQGCHVCSILDQGFLMKYANSTRSWGRFGKGLYFAPDAAKSNDYAVGEPNSGIKCLILCKVVVGKAMIYQTDQTTLTQPPPGYDSVLGETGQSLNFPELVIYNDSAILPAYVVFFK